MYMLDDDIQPWRTRKSSIGRDERAVSGLCGGDVEGVIGADRAVICPRHGCKVLVRNAVYRPAAKIIEYESRPRLVKVSVQHLPPQGREHFGVHQLRRQQLGTLNNAGHRLAERCPQQVFDRHRRVDDVSDYPSSLSRRARSSAMIVAAATPGSVVGRWARCSRHSNRSNSRSTALRTTALMLQLFSRAWCRRRS